MKSVGVLRTRRELERVFWMVINLAPVHFTLGFGFEAVYKVVYGPV